MVVLGIETSCDETAASIVKNGKIVLSNSVKSSLIEHKKYGGVIPEIASRMHVEVIDYVIKDALNMAGTKLEDVDLIATTFEPGLPGSLLIGTSFAKAMSFALNLKLIKVNHVHAHLYAAFLEKPRPKLPSIGLVISGGHSSIFKISPSFKFQLLASTQDDAIGEAFDKVAKILGLSYPGGPMIEKLAKLGDENRFKFITSKNSNKDFSFSGIKTAVLYKVNELKHNKVNKKWLCDIAASFQREAVNIIVEKTIFNCLSRKINRLVVGGGVASNTYLRTKLKEKADMHKIKLHIPDKKLCLDNAAMVAGLGYHIYKERINK
ncbi:MAG: tRNA (adenosine(37)-N6)-threonylcarbamoyltransferase complex transferase subunit TsaD [Candidatus Omnitrophota bacterium]